MNQDQFILLQLFENYRGIDVPLSHPELLQNVHGAYENPPTNRVWKASRLNKALDLCEADGWIEYRERWEITEKGQKARKEVTVDLMKAGQSLANA